MDPTLVAEIIRQIPVVLVIALVAAFGYRHRAEIGAFMTSRSHVKLAVAGFSVELTGEALQREIAAARPEQKVPPGIGDELAVRAARIGPILGTSLVLWVDDTPASTLAERRILHQLGIFVNTVVSTGEALDALRRGVGGVPYDLVISDIRRAADARAGLTMLERIRDRMPVPVVFYVGQVRPDGGPTGAYGITNRPDRLVELVLDALERRPVAAGLALADRADEPLAAE